VDDSQDQLSGLVEVWWRAVDDFSTLLEEVPPDRWDTPTDLPGWDVFALAAHTAHLEHLLAGGEHDEVDIGEVEHARGMMGHFTEQGVVARRGRTPDEVINQLRESATSRHTALLADPPTEPEAPAPGVFGAIGWSTLRLLRNRPLDIWMHEQDARRALDRPGNLDSPPAVHAVDYLAESFGLVLAKRAGAPAGTTAILSIAGHPDRAFEVGDDGRGQPLTSLPESPTLSIATDRESFVCLAGGRRTPPPDAVVVEGDQELGARVLASMAVTP
jgi:uncharacterized protein (TIGR03083 family)